MGRKYRTPAQIEVNKTRGEITLTFGPIAMGDVDDLLTRIGSEQGRSQMLDRIAETFTRSAQLEDI
jgi:hypothetical protein